MLSGKKRNLAGFYLSIQPVSATPSSMRKHRKIADFSWHFSDAEYVAQRLEYIAAHTEPAHNGCVEYTAYRTEDGYGRVMFAGRSWPVHRLLWLIHNGEIGELVIDHKCRNRACVNLDHLEPVSNKTNLNRGIHWLAEKRTCLRGHELEPMPPPREGWRMCRVCHRDRQRARYHASPEVRARQKANTYRNRAKARAARKDADSLA